MMNNSINIKYKYDSIIFASETRERIEKENR